MALVTRLLTNIGAPLVAQDGSVISNTNITFTLVNEYGNSVDTFDGISHYRVAPINKVVTTDSSGQFSVSLWPNSRGAKSTFYKCSVAHTGVSDFFGTVTDGTGELSWLDFKLSGDTLTVSETSAFTLHIQDNNKHLTQTEGDAIAAANSPSVNNPFATMADVGGGGGGSGHVVQDEGGAVATRAKLNFVGAGVTVTDDSANNATVVAISGGGSSSSIGSSTPTTLSGILKGNGVTISAAASGTDYVAPNSVITGATKTKITYDAKGLVTAGTDATTADIADSVNKRYITDAQKTVLQNTSGTNTGDQLTFKNIQVSGQSDIVADTATDTLTLAEGTGITITTNSATDTVTITATGEATPGAHATSHVTGGSDIIANAVANGNAGLMSGVDKSKLDGIAVGADSNINADWSAVSGDAQILNKPTLGTASSLNVPASGNAAVDEVVKGSDTRLTDARTPLTHNHDAAYAPIAKGVTNGDSHDHSGGDGAQIAYSSLSGTPIVPVYKAVVTGAYQTTAGQIFVGTLDPGVSLGANDVWIDTATGSDVTTDPVWDAKGDLVVGTGSNTSSKLIVGTDGQVLTADSTQTTGVKWSSVGGTGTVTSVGITAPAAGITSSGGPVTGSGAITLALANDLAAVEGLATTGYVKRTAADTWSTTSSIPGSDTDILTFKTVAVSGQTSVVADSLTDTLTIAAGTGIAITTDATTDTVTITATGAATPGAHATSHVTGGSDIIANAVAGGNSGLMSGADKTKLDAVSNDAVAGTASMRTLGTGAAQAAAGNHNHSGTYEVPLTISTGLTRNTNTITVNTSQNISTLSNLVSDGFVKTSGGTGALSIDTTSYVPTTLTVNGHALSGNVSVTASDVGNATAQWNASQIRGINVDSAAMTTGDYLSYDGSNIIHSPITKSTIGLPNVENTAISTWAGSSSITTLGTVTTGQIKTVSETTYTGGTITTNSTIALTDGHVQTYTLGGANIVFTLPAANALSSQSWSIIIELTCDGSARSFTWSGIDKWINTDGGINTSKKALYEIFSTGGTRYGMQIYKEA